MALLQRVEDTAMPSEESGCDCFSFFSFHPDSNSAFCSDNNLVHGQHMKVIP